MGRTSIAGLIARGQNENAYNNSGISTPAVWVDFFNEALQDLVEDIGLLAYIDIPYVVGTSSYNLPADFFQIDKVYDAFQMPVHQRQAYGHGYSLSFDGKAYKIDFGTLNSAQTFRVYYIRYPAQLNTMKIDTDTPEIPTIGENALIVWAIAKGLRNSNQIGQAVNLEQKYELERKKIRDATQRAKIGG